jgi:hypothetical protein
MGLSFVISASLLLTSAARGAPPTVELSSPVDCVLPGEPIPAVVRLTLPEPAQNPAPDPLQRRVKLHAYVRLGDSADARRTFVPELDRALLDSGELVLFGLVLPREPDDPFDDSALRPGTQYHICVADEAASLRSSEIVISLRTARDAEVAAARAFHAHLRAVVGMIEQGDEFEAVRPALSKLISDYPSTPFARYAGAAT